MKVKDKVKDQVKGGGGGDTKSRGRETWVETLPKKEKKEKTALRLLLEIPLYSET